MSAAAGPPAGPPAAELLATAVAAAEAAGAVARERRGAHGAVSVKGFRDIVTEADVAAQAAAEAVIAARFPDHGILGEESGPAAREAAGRAGTVWVVDPIDGTTNYSRGFPIFAVSIGVIAGGAPVAGAVVDPLRRQTFYAARGGGAYLREGTGEPRRLSVSGAADLAGALAGLDWARDPAERAQVLAYLGRLAPACRTVRAIGSAALGVTYVAAGWIDVYYHLSLAPWDALAGVVILREAGGRASELPERLTAGAECADWDLSMPRLLATNGALHGAALAALLG